MPESTEFTFTSLGVPYWANRQEEMGQVILVDGDPRILTRGFDGEEKIYSLEELWVLGSSIVMDRFRKPNRLAQEVFFRRASVGNQVIRQLWREHGYASKGESTKSSRVKVALSPVRASKGRKAPLAREQVLVNLVFGTLSNSVGWALRVEGDSTVLSQADWNDLEGIRELAKRALDRDYCLAMFALMQPSASQNILSKKDRYNKQVALYTLLSDYAINNYTDVARLVENSFINKLKSVLNGYTNDSYIFRSNYIRRNFHHPDDFGQCLELGLEFNIISSHIPNKGSDNFRNSLSQGELAEYEARKTRMLAELEMAILALPDKYECLLLPASKNLGTSEVIKIGVARNARIYEDYLNENKWGELIEYLRSKNTEGERE